MDFPTLELSGREVRLNGLDISRCILWPEGEPAYRLESFGRFGRAKLSLTLIVNLAEGQEADVEGPVLADAFPDLYPGQRREPAEK